jgi:hypothetical protein
MIIKGIIVLILLVGGFFLFQRLYFAASGALSIQENQTEVANASKKATDDYFKLIEEQKKRSSTSPLATPIPIIDARGSHKVFMVLVKPKNLSISEIEPLVNVLNNSSTEPYTDCTSGACVKNSSLNFIPSYYRQEALRFGVSDFNLSLSTTPVYSLESIEKAGDIGYLWGKDPFATVKIEDAFIKILNDNNISVSPKDFVIFLFFDNTLTPDSSGEGRFYEHKVFRSFAKPETKRAFVNIYSFNPQFAKVVVETTAHELLHLFGATDKYEEKIASKRVCSERGRGDTEKNPAVPQDSTDIMCGYIEKVNDKFERGSFIDGTVIINQVTATEIGWK